MSITYIPSTEGEALLDWLEFAEALAAGHSLPKAEVADTFLYRGKDTLLSRAAWIDGMGQLVKTATIFPGNADRNEPTINGAVTLFSDHDGSLSALVDFHLVTKWKTAGDSLLGALRLASPDSREVLIVGAGTVAASLIEAFSAGFPEAKIRLWNRTLSKAEDLAAAYPGTEVAPDLETAVRAADIIVTATMSTQPVIKGAWLRPGQHLNMIGAYRPDMREADDEAMRRARIFVDSRDTTIHHIGEIALAIASGAITEQKILADYYDLAAFTRAPDDITLFKNGGGAHLDLMTARHILTAWTDAQ